MPVGKVVGVVRGEGRSPSTKDKKRRPAGLLVFELCRGRGGELELN